ETQETPTLRLQVIERLEQAEECVNMEDLACALEHLNRVRQMRDLNTFEIVQLYRYYAFVYISDENYTEAIGAYETVLEQPELPIAIATEAMLALAQLYVQQERFEEGLEMLDLWFMYA